MTNSLEQNVDKILLTILDIQNSLTKFATKDDLALAKSEIMTQTDVFIQLHQKLDVELAALRGQYIRLEEQIAKISAHLHLEWKEA